MYSIRWSVEARLRVTSFSRRLVLVLVNTGQCFARADREEQPSGSQVQQPTETDERLFRDTVKRVPAFCPLGVFGLEGAPLRDHRLGNL